MGKVRQFVDGLQNLVTGLGTRADARTSRAYLAHILSPQEIEAAFEASPMLRKAIRIPASDRIRAWRNWQADEEQIKLLEAEEERHQIQAKVKQGELLRGLGGGALILVAAGDPAMPLNVTGKGGLVAVNAVSRWHISGHEWVDEISSPDYGTPRYWTMSTAKAAQQRIHPSRVVCFRAEPLPSIWTGSWDDRFWGRGRVPSLLEPAQNLDEALATFAAMIKDSLNVDIGIPKLLEMVATAEGEARLMRRLSLMQQGSSVIRAKVYDSGDAEGKGGEKIDRHQVDWTGIPDVIRVYAEALSAASDIPVTRLWGTSAKGLNATGEGDANNYDDMVVEGRDLETKPCLNQIDAALIPSALGSRPDEIWWKFGDLDVPTEKEDTDRFKVWVEAAEKVQLSGTIPDEAFAKAYQNGLSENGWMPGLDGALAQIPENERFGLDPEADDTDPSQIQAQQPKGGDPGLAGRGGARDNPARRAANDAATWLADATPRPLYVQRKLLNAAEVVAWAKGQGFDVTLRPEDMHVTILYSRAPVDPMKMGRDWREDEKAQIIVRPGGPRVLERFNEGAVVLRFASPDLEWRHRDLVEAGGSHDWPEYHPHVTLTYAAPEGMDLDAVEPFRGKLVFGPEIFEGLDLDWKSKVGEE
jgi:phage-related protein (TIGR01555 family)